MLVGVFSRMQFGERDKQGFTQCRKRLTHGLLALDDMRFHNVADWLPIFRLHT